MFVKPFETYLHKPRECNVMLWYFCGPETGGKCKGCYQSHQHSKFKGTTRKSKKQKGDEPKNNLGNKVTINEAVEEIHGGYEST